MYQEQQTNQKEIERIYNLCINSTYEETELTNEQTISLIDLRDTAIDGGYENDKEAYIEMIEKELERLTEEI